MRLWIVSILATVVSVVVLVIVMGQHQMLTRLNESSQAHQMKLENVDNELINEDYFKVTVETLLVQGKRVVNDLEATATKLSSEMEKKKKENDACQAEKKTKNDELSATEKERTETEATLKAESDAWKQEIKTLTARLTARSPLCSYIEKTTQYKALCPSTPLL